jgi:hypothetical protein
MVLETLLLRQWTGLDIDKSKLYKHILIRDIKANGDFYKVDRSLLKEGLQSEKLQGLMRRLLDSKGLVYDMVYPEVTDPHYLTWFKNINDALKYIQEFLITEIKDKERAKSKKIMLQHREIKGMEPIPKNNRGKVLTRTPRIFY